MNAHDDSSDPWKSILLCLVVLKVALGLVVKVSGMMAFLIICMIWTSKKPCHGYCNPICLHLLHTLTSKICAWHYCFIDHFTLELEPTFCSCVHLTFHKERIAVDAKV